MKSELQNNELEYNNKIKSEIQSNVEEYDRDKERDRDTYRNSRIRREDSYSKYENKKRY